MPPSLDVPRPDRGPLLHRDQCRTVQPGLRLHALPRCRRTPQTRQGHPMTNNGKYISLYDLRVKMVQKALQDHSNLDDKTSFDLAVHVLEALDHIPEKAR